MYLDQRAAAPAALGPRCRRRRPRAAVARAGRLGVGRLRAAPRRPAHLLPLRVAHRAVGARPARRSPRRATGGRPSIDRLAPASRAAATQPGAAASRRRRVRGGAGSRALASRPPCGGWRSSLLFWGLTFVMTYPQVRVLGSRRQPGHRRSAAVHVAAGVGRASTAARSGCICSTGTSSTRRSTRWRSPTRCWCRR